MTRNVLAVSLLGIALGGCHTHQVGRGDRAPEARKDDKPGEQQARSHEVHMDISSGRPVHTTPRGFLSASEIRQVQYALRQKGENAPESGKLDGTTIAALKHFQKENHQPQTGFPDFGTLNLLGLDANQLYGGKADKETGAAGIVK